MSEDLDKLEYGQTTDLLRTLTDVRFRLLAFTPTIAGAAVALLSRGSHASSLLAVGTLGFMATIGVLAYERHNTAVYEYAIKHAEELEARLGLGLFRSRPHYAHDRPLAIVYAVVLGAWGYLVAWGSFAASGVGPAQVLGGITGGTVAVAAGGWLAYKAQKMGEPAVAGSPALTSSGS